MTANELIIKYENLVYYVYTKNMDKLIPYYKDEYVSEGFEGLIFAANTFDASKGFAFTTYAYRCILNKMFMYQRHVHAKYSLDTSINDVAFVSNSGDTLSYEDMLESEDEFVKIEERETMNEIFKSMEIAYKSFNDNERKIIKYMLEGHRQREISELTGLSQPQVSRYLKRMKSKIKQIYDDKQYMNSDTLTRSDYLDFDDYMNELQKRMVNNGTDGKRAKSPRENDESVKKVWLLCV